ncbi:MAG: anti-sigma factor [Candidatus Acidiferrales bacterium]
MTHSEMDELYELYALGTLEPEQAAEIEAHLGDECPYCLEHVREALATTAAMSGLAEQKAPPRALRSRILENVAAVPPRKPYPWMLVIGLSAACLALVGFAIWAGVQIVSLGDRVGTLTAQRNELRAAVQVLSQPEAQKIGFAGAVNAPHGRVFVNRAGFVFVGSQMPGLPSNSTFELWIIPKQGAPQPAGLFRSNPQGSSARVGMQPVNVAQIKAFAVTVEPRRGSKAPTTKPFLVMPIG